MKDVEIIGMLKAYIKASLVGVGALKGAPCQCVITENADGTHKVTMKWVDDNNVTHTDSFDVLNGQVGEFADISDVSLTNLEDGQVVAYNSTTQKWENVANSATVNSLNNVGDVTITTVQDGQALVWSDILSKWVNKDIGITIDNALSLTSENPVQNKVLYLALEDKADKATTLSGYGISDAYTKTETDAAITAEIEKLDASDSAVAGSYVTAVSEADGKISVTREAADETPTANSKKMLTSGGAKAALDAKQDTLTFDDAPTENSDNPVKSGGVYASEQSINKVINANWSDGGKNLWANGDISGTAYVSVSLKNPLPAGSYTFSAVVNSSDTDATGCLVNDITNNTQLGLIARSTGTERKSITFTLAQPTSEIALYASITYAQSTGDTFSFTDIQIEKGTTATSYAPFAKDNLTLTAENEALTNKLEDEAATRSALGAKNILPFDLTDIKALNTNGSWEGNVYTYRGVAFTVNSDGTISATGTATGGNASIKIFAASSNYEMLGKEVILNGCPSNGSATTYRIQAYRMASADGSTGTNFDDGTGTDAFTVLNNASGTVGSFAVAVYEDATVTNLLFEPMVRLASDSDDTYQPYAKTNRELTSEQGYCTEDQYTAIQTLLS